jgi:hypothetical protein
VQLTLEERLAATCKQKLAAAQTSMEREEFSCLEEFENACKQDEGATHGTAVLGVEENAATGIGGVCLIQRNRALPSPNGVPGDRFEMDKQHSRWKNIRDRMDLLRCNPDEFVNRHGPRYLFDEERYGDCGYDSC